MDRLIRRFDWESDADLRLCAARGIAYQTDMTAGRVTYGSDYLAKCAAYEGSAIAMAVNAGRCELLVRHLPQPATVLDFGAGSGAFMRAAALAGYDTKGFDVIPEVAAQLKQQGCFSDDLTAFDAVTMWDTIEHLREPEKRLKRILRGALLFVSIPVFDDLRRIRKSKHYRPGEHLYYWTAQGFIDWMALYGFRLLEQSDHETAAGRDSIGAFAFKRDLPDYADHIAAYNKIHSTRYYGSSATELHLAQIAKVVQTVAPASILDYGCGRSDMVAHFWLDGKRRIARYDPAIGAYKRMPEGHFDLVLCCDVLEHIPMASVDMVLGSIRARSTRALFTISTKPSRARLPDGRNAHVTLLSSDEWINWLRDEFDQVAVLESQWEHELVLLAEGK